MEAMLAAIFLRAVSSNLLFSYFQSSYCYHWDLLSAGRMQNLWKNLIEKENSFISAEYYYNYNHRKPHFPISLIT